MDKNTLPRLFLNQIIATPFRNDCLVYTSVMPCTIYSQSITYARYRKIQIIFEYNFFQIPVTLAQFEELLTFQKILASKKMLEPLAALKSLLLQKAFRLKLFQSMYDPVTHKKYLSEEELPNYSRKPIAPFSRIKQIQSHQAVGELKYIHNMYTKVKRVFQGISA